MDISFKQATQADRISCTIAEFRDRLTQSGVLDGDALRAALLRLQEGAEDSAQPVADSLVQSGLLTRFQAATLLRDSQSKLVLGNYVVLDLLGHGGMGNVFKARHRRLKRVLALKVLSAAALKSPADLARFQSEVQAAGQLEHPNIVTAYDADEVDGTQFLAMEFIDGLDLQALVEALGPLPVAEAMQCVWQAAQGLAFAHEKGVVHRDIKPANLILGTNGRLRILDMGIAQLVGRGGSEDPSPGGFGPAMGTLDFLAPEQARLAAAPDPRSDLYSLGCTLYFLLAGRAPFAGFGTANLVAAHREAPMPGLSDSRSGVPEGVDSLLIRLTAKSPAARIQSAAELIAELEPIVVAHRVQADGLGRLVIEARRRDSERNPQIPGRFQSTGEARSEPLTAEVTAPLVAEADDALQSPESSRPRWRRRSAVLATLGLCIAATLLVAIVLRGWNAEPGIARDSMARSTLPPSTRAARWVLEVGGIIHIKRETSWESVTELSELPEEPYQVMTVQLGGNEAVDNDGLRHLAGATSLQMLWLGETAVSDAGLVHLMELRSLRFIGLSETAVSDAGLVALQDLTALRTLRLGGTNVSDAGLQRLTSLSNLDTLDLSNTAVSDAGLEHLGSLQRLRELDVRGTEVTAGGAARLKSRLPECTIFL